MARQRSVAKEQTQPPARRGRKGVASARGRRELVGKTITANQTRFDGLIALDIKAAHAARLYAQMMRGRYLSQAEICLALGVPHESNVSWSICAVLYYLDPTIEVGNASKHRADQIARHVEKSHRLTAEKAEQEKEREDRKLAAKLSGVREVPDSLPPELFARWQTTKARPSQ